MALSICRLTLRKKKDTSALLSFLVIIISIDKTTVAVFLARRGEIMTQGELNALMAEMIASLTSLGIPLSKRIVPEVKVNTRAKKRLGCCILQSYVYTIEISQFVLSDEQLLRETMAHELLHTCKSCRNHGERWKQYAAIVNKELGYNISRTVKIEGGDVRLREEANKYLLVCTSCGTEIWRARMSKTIKSPWRYRCGKCGGKLKRML